MNERVIEEWRPVPGYADIYEASDLGRLRNVKTGKPVNGTQYTHGYVIVCLSRNGVVKRTSMHRVVASAWIGECPPCLQVDHIDGCRTNNAASNLRYLTAAENIRATVARDAHAVGEGNGQAKLTAEQVAEIRAAKKNGPRYWGRRELATKFGVHISQIQRAARGSTFASPRAAAIRDLAQQGAAK
jgi:hypothetical protein